MLNVTTPEEALQQIKIMMLAEDMAQQNGKRV